MAIVGCQGRPDGALCPTPSRTDARLSTEDGQSYCEPCLRAIRLHKRNGGRSVDTTSDGNAGNQNGNQASETAPETPSDVIFDPLLAYVIYARFISGGTTDMTKNAVLSGFTSEKIKIAKSLLWKTSLVDVIGQFQNRRGSEVRSLDEANVMDILGALEKLDRADRMPLVAILSTQLSMIPRSHPEEVLPISVGDRMNRTEHRLSQLTDLVERVVAENADMRDEIRNLMTSSPQADSHTSPPKQENKKKNKRKGPVAKMPGGATLNALPDAPNLCNSLPPPGSDSDAGGDDGDDSQGRFTRVDYGKRRSSKKPDIVTGTGGSSLSSFTGVEPNRHLYVGRVAADATEDDLKNWIKDRIGVELRHFQKLPPPQNRPPSSDSQSFWITVPMKDCDTASKPESWPDGVIVRRFFPARSSDKPKS